MDGERGREEKGDQFHKHNLLSHRNFIMLSVPSVHTTEKRNNTISN